MGYFKNGQAFGKYCEYGLIDETWLKNPGIYQGKKNCKMENGTETLNFTDFLENELTEDMNSQYIQGKNDTNIKDIEIPIGRMSAAEKYNDEKKLTIHKWKKLANQEFSD